MKDLVVHYNVLQEFDWEAGEYTDKDHWTTNLATPADDLIARGTAIRDKGKKYTGALPDYYR